MISRHMTIGSFVVLFLSLVCFHSTRVRAIPAFARKYNMGCNTCHIAVPKRNAFGEAVRRNGYMIPTIDAELVKDPPVPLGREGSKRIFPRAVWPGTLPGSFPLSAYVHQRVEFDFDHPSGDTRVEFDMPHEVEVMVGGTFDKTFSFFGDMVIIERGEPHAELKRVLIQANDLIGPENALNLRLGRLEPGITDGMTDNQRISLEHALTVDYRATGRWRPRDRRPGIEANGILAHRYQYALGIVESRSAGTETESDDKDLYARIATKFGGLALDGYVSDSVVATPTPAAWADNAVTIGVYVYNGREYVAPGETNQFVRYGGDLQINYQRIDLTAGVISGVDENPHIDGLLLSDLSASWDTEDLSSTAWFAGADVLVYPWLIPGFRVSGASSHQGRYDYDDFTILSPYLVVLARANIRVSVEGFVRFEGDRQRPDPTDPGRDIILRADNDEALKWIKLNTMFVF